MSENITVTLNYEQYEKMKKEASEGRELKAGIEKCIEKRAVHSAFYPTSFEPIGDGNLLTRVHKEKLKEVLHLVGDVEFI
jgi:hypothetical protein